MGTTTVADNLEAEQQELFSIPIRQAEGYFRFKSLEPTPVKGKTEPIQVY